ncbi:glycosyltransferase family 4 protein [Hyphococcus sp.]|jgi:UDP-N-acetylmuramyl pentapeptide phosphotransferase/UDP-N-acetylglucosamine-1-phosphate transferase|uniref:glycosyltransferase family 4 protein n=1 Tax=Hyphococcus sp. TaxID=2038636 RepID=UPI003D0F8E8F
MLIEPFIFACAGAVAAAVAYCASLYAAQLRRVLDHPNERSSHAKATPRSGGAAIMAGFLAGVFVICAFAGDIDAAGKLGGLALCGALAFALGFADDRMGLPPIWKLAGQVVIAALFVILFAPLQAVPLPWLGEVAIPPAIGVPLTILWIAGFMNAFNFMDGANGMAGGAAAVGLAWFAVIASFTGAPVLAAAALLLALSAAAFLPENLLRGKLFMGDNGSMALGFFIAAFAVLGVNWTDGRLAALVMPVIFLPFLFDVAWTLVSRLIRKQNVLDAHREHFYQLMMRLGASHARVAVTYMSLISLSAAAAILMLASPASLHWLTPLILSLIFAMGGIAIYRPAWRKGLLEKSQETNAALSAAE